MSDDHIQTAEAAIQEARRLSGGGAALARKLGISRQSVLRWRRAPASRVLPIEAATGVHRTLLRPDLYPSDGPSALALTESLRHAAAE